MANEDKNSDLGLGTIIKIAFGVGLGMLSAMKLTEWAEEKSVPYAKKKISEGVEYLKDIKKKKTEEALKVDDTKE